MKESRRSLWTLLLVGAALLPMTGCDVLGGEDDQSNVTVQFAVDAEAGGAQQTDEEVVVTGTNGTLRITEMHMLVSELKFENTSNACDGTDDDDNEDGCAEVEAEPFLLHLPFDEPTVVASEELSAGTYNRMEIEIGDLDLEDDESEDDDKEERDHLEELADDIRKRFSDWPEDASILVVGTFTAKGSTTAQPFRSYLRSEVDIKQTLNPALEITEGGPNRSVSIAIDPALWFRTSTGLVLDLTKYTGSTLLSLEAIVRNGFVRVEVEAEND